MRLRTFTNNISLSLPFFPSSFSFLPSTRPLIFVSSSRRLFFVGSSRVTETNLKEACYESFGARARACAYIRAFDSRERERERRKSRREKSGWAKTRAEERRRTKGEERCHQPLWWTVTNCAKVLTLLSTGTFPSPPFPSPRNVAYANGENGRVVSLRRIHREERVDRAFFLPPRKFASLFLLSFVHRIFLPSPLGGFSLNLFRIFPSILER